MQRNLWISVLRFRSHLIQNSSLRFLGLAFAFCQLLPLTCSYFPKISNGSVRNTFISLEVNKKCIFPSWTGLPEVNWSIHLKANADQASLWKDNDEFWIEQLVYSVYVYRFRHIPLKSVSNIPTLCWTRNYMMINYMCYNVELSNSCDLAETRHLPGPSGKAEVRQELSWEHHPGHNRVPEWQKDCQVCSRPQEGITVACHGGGHPRVESVWFG